MLGLSQEWLHSKEYSVLTRSGLLCFPNNTYSFSGVVVPNNTQS